MSVTTVAADTDLRPWRADAQVIGCVGLAHLVSHFFQLLLPPLLPWIKAEFHLSFAALGFLMTVLFVVSAITQMLAGFIVDRLGPGPTLATGLACFVAAAGVLALATTYPLLLVGAALSGVGNIAVGPVLFGRLLDAGHHGAVFLGVAVLLLIAMLTAAGVAARTPAVP